MPLPTFHCPACRNPLTFEVVVANESVRECIKLLVQAHPSASRLLRPLLAYVGLFAPAKQQAIRYERMAAILGELVPMIRDAQITRNGRTWPAPLAYWEQALDQVVERGHGGTLKLPLKSHGYLLEVLAQLASQADSKAEQTLERSRSGYAGAGSNPQRAGQSVVSAQPARTPMPEGVREQLRSIIKKEPS